MDTIGRSVSIILLVILFLLFPLRYDAVVQEQSCELYVHNETNRLLNTIIQTQELTLEQYQNYSSRIFDTQSRYEIHVECYETKYLLENETKVNYLDYVNVLEELDKKGVISFHHGDYISINLQQKDSFTKRLMNLFIPTFPTSEYIQIGGCIT